MQKKALTSIERIVSEEEKRAARNYLEKYLENIDDFGTMQIKQFNEEVKNKAREKSIKIVKYVKKEGPWEREAATIIPKRMKVGTLTLDGIPDEEWRETRSSPRWWSASNWAAASYWWCDGERNLNEIKELIELEAGTSVRNFDLINYYKFLEQYGMVKFVKKK